VLDDVAPDPKGDGGDDPGADLEPSVLVGDPERFYSTLEQLLAAASFGPDPNPSTISPASRLVGTCRNLDR
jgi:hypothetical protein